MATTALILLLGPSKQWTAEPAPNADPRLRPVSAAMTRMNRPSSRYRKLALKNHPLKSGEPTAAETFRQIAEAYDVLSDRE